MSSRNKRKAAKKFQELAGPVWVLFSSKDETFPNFKGDDQCLEDNEHGVSYSLWIAQWAA